MKPTVTELFSQSLAKAKLPAESKTVVIYPLFKGGARDDPVNYRRVIQTCVVDKVIFATLLRSHLLVNRLFWSEKQDDSQRGRVDKLAISSVAMGIHRGHGSLQGRRVCQI